MPDLELIIDTPSRRLMHSLHSREIGRLPTLTVGDALTVDVIPVIASGADDPVFRSVDWSDPTIALSIGRHGAAPTSGEYTLTYGGETTDPIGPHMTAGQLAGAIASLPAIVAAGGVYVGKHNSFYKIGLAFEVRFIEPGARTAFTATNLGLSPGSTISFSTLTTGDATQSHVELVTVLQSPMASTTEFEEGAATTLSVVEETAGNTTTAEIQLVELSPLPLGGVWEPIVQGARIGRIPWNATAREFQSALDELSIDAMVRQIGAAQWRLFFGACVAQVPVTADLTGILHARRWRGTITIDSAVLRAQSVRATILPMLQVQCAYGSGSIINYLSQPATISAENIL